MSEMKKYTKVIRYNHKKNQDILESGNIIVQEKLDGANASFTWNEITNTIDVFSRNCLLDEENDLRGYYAWAKQLDEELVKENPHYIYFGEWLVKHKLHYGPHMDQFYLFDIFDQQKRKYLPFDTVRQEAERLGLKVVPVFYEGPTCSAEELKQYVGKSLLGEVGEGIVIKNVSYVDPFGIQIYVKMVSDAFSEKLKKKERKDHVVTQEELFISTYLTTARVEKFLYKLVDEGILQEDFGVEEMPIIIRELSYRLYEDLIEEEGDSLDAEFDHKLLRRMIGKKLPKQVKALLEAKILS